jgi:hypothetical protein
MRVPFYSAETGGVCTPCGCCCSGVLYVVYGTGEEAICAGRDVSGSSQQLPSYCSGSNSVEMLAEASTFGSSSFSSSAAAVIEDPFSVKTHPTERRSGELAVSSATVVLLTQANRRWKPAVVARGAAKY